MVPDGGLEEGDTDQGAQAEAGPGRSEGRLLLGRGLIAEEVRMRRIAGYMLLLTAGVAALLARKRLRHARRR